MTFLDPFVLLGLAAAAVPLLLHLFNLRRPRRVDFSSLEFLKSLQQRTMQRVRIKQWLLLLLRILAIASLVLAFARPTLTGNLAGTVGQTRTSWALVVDNTLSMTVRDGQGAYLEQAKDAAMGIAEAMDPDDEAFLLTTAQGAEGNGSAPYRSPGAVQEALDAIETRPGGTTTARSVARAVERLGEAAHLNKEIYVITDRQASTLADSIAAEVPDDIGVTLVPIGSRTPANVAVTDVRVQSRIVEAGQPVQVEATLTNYGSEPLEGYVASTYLEGERVAQATATLEPGQSTTVDFTATPQQRGWLAGTVEVEDDAFAHDNVRHFTLHVPRERELLVVQGEAQSTRHIDLALSPELVQGRLAFRTETIAEDALAATSLGSYDAVVLAGPASLSSGEVAALARYVEAGGGLLFFPSQQAPAADYNALFDALGGGRFSGFSGTLGEEQVIATFDRVDLQHTLFEGVFDRADAQDDVQVESPDVYYAMNYSPGSGMAQTLIELSNGFPFLQEVRHGSGVALLTAVAADPQWSDLPVRGLFIPLLYRSMYYLSAGESAAGEQLTGGQPGELRVTGVPEGEPLRIIGPNGTERTPEQRTLFGATLLQTDASMQTPGIYDVMAGDSLVRRVALNLDARESDLRTAPDEEAVQALSEALGREVGMLDPGADRVQVAETVQQRRVGTEIWNVFLLLALGLLVTEMLVASQWRPESVSA